MFHSTWAARYITWLLINMMPKGVVFSCLFFSDVSRYSFSDRRPFCSQNPSGHWCQPLLRARLSWVICSVPVNIGIHFLLSAKLLLCRVVLTEHEQETVLCITSCLMVVVGLHTVPSCVDPAIVSSEFLVLAC